jgi:hypothetical protein
VLEQPWKGAVEDVNGQPKQAIEEKTMEVGTSSQPPWRKFKQMVPRSPHRKSTATIVFPCMPEGVSVKEDLLGYVKKLRYSDHDVMDTNKFPTFSKKVTYKLWVYIPLGNQFIN